MLGKLLKYEFKFLWKPVAAVAAITLFILIVSGTLMIKDFSAFPKEEYKAFKNAKEAYCDEANNMESFKMLVGNEKLVYNENTDTYNVTVRDYAYDEDGNEYVVPGSERFSDSSSCSFTKAEYDRKMNIMETYERTSDAYRNKIKSFCEGIEHDENYYNQLYDFILYVSMFALAIIVIILLQRYQKGMFGKEGYLLYSIPVKRTALYFSKVISAIAALAVITLLNVFPARFLLLQIEYFYSAIDINEFGYLFDLSPFFSIDCLMLPLICLIVSTFAVCILFCGITLGYSHGKKQILHSIVYSLIFVTVTFFGILGHQIQAGIFWYVFTISMMLLLAVMFGIALGARREKKRVLWSIVYSVAFAIPFSGGIYLMKRESFNLFLETLFSNRTALQFVSGQRFFYFAVAVLLGFISIAACIVTSKYIKKHAEVL